MIPVTMLAMAADVVQESEVFDDFEVGAGMHCQAQTVHPDARPMGCTVNTAPVEAELLAQPIEQARGNNPRPRLEVEGLDHEAFFVRSAVPEETLRRNIPGTSSSARSRDSVLEASRTENRCFE